MLTHETIVTPCEFKFTEGGAPGEFTGYGSVFNTLDDHGDVVLPGAFAASIASHKGSGTMPGMYVEHSGFKGGDPLPVGVWQDMTEDENGLLVKGRISALDTDHGKRIVGLMRDKALPGLSIAYVVPTGGAIYGKKAGEPRRQIKQMDLHSVDIVRDPSNRAARIYQMKSLLAHADHSGAVAAVVAAIKLHRATMMGGNSPTAEERAQMHDHLTTAHQCLTGEPMPAGMKSKPETIRQFEAWLREACGYSNSEAREIAERGFKSAQTPRDEDEAAAAAQATKAALQGIADTFAGFTLPSFGD